ncbi:unnamed protein product [Rotaria sordida]|uniref:Uncharacterized protein n=1 Tax=Rotaria sordida TaxID=392033 RepID=A0A818VKI4_9BILA|nr:unnamed protein product [Rotaria sordida]CAF1057384.1 unnamed protein product [Rotaria sordida]CAF1104679.1 unnamed protein product [Rotaria sordida]CAF3708952.1 unnamed protein product [Rotaria sordida]CAF3715310.1 unnamed protein product [Rotaria sordida]
MLLLLLILIIQYISAETDLKSNETRLEIEKLNALKYEHHSKIFGLQAEFSFKILNITYAIYELNIDSYYFSITFIDEEHHEERTEIEDLPNNETNYHGQLNLKNLDAEGNYLICVFFLTNNQTNLIGSSRFCHVVSISDSCQLEQLEISFTNQPVYILLILVVVLLVIVVIVTYVRRCIYRPRNFEERLKTLPEHHANDLTQLAGLSRRRNRELTTSHDRLRGESISTIGSVPYDDHEPVNYNGYDNRSLTTLTE